MSRYMTTDGLVVDTLNATSSWHGVLHRTRKGRYWMVIKFRGMQMAEFVSYSEAARWIKKHGFMMPGELKDYAEGAGL